MTWTRLGVDERAVAHSILVTGGSGSFGHAFVRYLLSLKAPTRIAIYSRDELKQMEMAAALGQDSRLRFFLGDVRDEARLRRAMFGVDVVVHAAAQKQVPASEYNPTEAIATNVLGAQNVIEAAIDAGVRKVVALSTDKACSPSTLYGATKLCMERLFVAANSLSGTHGTRFACTRYGNVAKSRGSVVPVWRAAVEAGRPIEVTDPEATRFHMLQQQAVDLVLLALREMRGGEVFIPLLRSYRLAELADAVAGATHPRVVVGLRPAEKVHESLVSEDELRTARDYGDHIRLLPDIHPWSDETLNGGKPLLSEYRSDGRCMTGEELRELVA